MFEFGKALSKLNNDSFQGAYIGKIKYEIYKKKDIGEYFSYIQKENRTLAIIILEKNIFFWKKITNEEIYEFSKLTGDKNYIHLVDKPVVQGMLILNEIIKNIDEFKELEIKFINPIFGEEEIFLEKDKRNILAYSNNKLCFKVTFK